MTRIIILMQVMTDYSKKRNFKVKKILLKFVVVFLIAGNLNLVYAQKATYSTEAINLYNSGCNFQKTGKYELAEQKYNQALKIQPNLAEAKKNLAIIYHNKAINSYANNDIDSAVELSKKSLVFDSKLIESYTILARSYSDLEDYPNAVDVYSKILAMRPKDYSSLQSLAQIYIKTRNYEEAETLYRQILALSPEDPVAKQNLHYVSFQKTETTLNKKINEAKALNQAPKSVYRLIKPSAGITPKTVNNMEKILDLVWSEPNGQLYLQAMADKKVPIKITQGTLSANATVQQKQNTLMLYGFIPVYQYKTSSFSVNVPFNYISDFYDSGLDSYKRIYSLQVFLHEFGHMYMNIKNPGNANSLEEELGVTMIGYNAAHKILTDSYLNKEQTEKYSMESLESLLQDEHRTLPVYSGFNRTIQGLGITMPYPEVYSDLPTMYKKLLNEKKVYPAETFFRYVNR